MTITTNTSAPQAATPTDFVGLGDAVSAFSETLSAGANTIADRVRIVMQFRAANPNASQRAACEALQNAMESAIGHENIRKYSGWKRASLERLDAIGNVIAHNGWTLDGPTASALATLLEDNRDAFNALKEGRKKQLSALGTAYAATEKKRAEKRKEDADKRAAAKKREDEAKQLAADVAAGKVNPDAITPAALVGSIRERVGKQWWTPEEIASFQSNMRAYLDTLDAVATADAQS